MGIIWVLYGYYMVNIWLLYVYCMVIIVTMMVKNILLGGAITILKNDGSSSMGRMTSHIWKIIHSCLKPPTRNNSAFHCILFRSYWLCNSLVFTGLDTENWWRTPAADSTWTCDMGSQRNRGVLYLTINPMVSNLSFSLWFNYINYTCLNLMLF